MLEIKINNEEMVEKVTGEDFEGTPLEGQDFEIEVRKLNRTEKIDASSKAMDKDGNLSNGSYSKALFTSSIANITNIINPETQEILSADELWDYAPDILINKISKTIESFTKAEDEKKSDSENGLNPTQIGQPIQ